jgi:hypothetical protein
MISPKPKKERIVFPENITSVVSEVVKNYNILEKDDEATEKIIKGETTKGEKLAEIIKKTATGEILIKNLPTVLKETFNVSSEDSKKLAGEIEEKILSLAQKFSEEEETSAKLKVIKKVQPSKIMEESASIKKDIYRESTE